MLCIILTKKKLLAGIGKEEGEILYINLDANPGNISPLKVLENGLPTIADTYKEFMESLGEEVISPIPTAITTSPLGASSSSTVFQQILKVFAGKSDIFQPIYTEFLPQSFVRGISPSMTGQAGVVMEAIDEALTVYYQNIHYRIAKSKVKPQKISENLSVLPFDKASPKGIVNFLVKAASDKLGQAGLMVKDMDRLHLGKQFQERLETGVNGHEIELSRHKNGVNISAKLSFSDKDYKQTIAQSMKGVEALVDKDRLKNLGVKFITFIGTFPENALQNYLGESLGLKDLLVNTEISEFESYKTLIKGLHHEAIKHKPQPVVKKEPVVVHKPQLVVTPPSPVKAVNMPEEKKAIHSPQLSRVAAKIQPQQNPHTQSVQELKGPEPVLDITTAREQFMDRIRLECVDPSQKQFYESTFLPEGAKLSIPEDVIKWNISETLRKLGPVAVEPPKAKSVQEEMNRNAALSKQPALEIPLPGRESENIVEELNPNEFPGTNFEVVGVLYDPEFSSMKVIAEGDPNIRVARFLRDWESTDVDQVKKFEYLYNKELVYYGELSEMYSTPQGKYYFRDYVSHKTLKEYVKKIGLDKKQSLDKYTSKDIKLILQVLEEVERLPVSHANLNETNILVNRKGLINHHLEITFVGFTAEDCALSDMKDAVHQTFSSILGKRIYSKFKSKLKL